MCIGSQAAQGIGSLQHEIPGQQPFQVKLSGEVNCKLALNCYCYCYIYIYLILYPYRVPGAKQELTTNSLHSIEPTVWFSVRGCQFSMMVEISLAKQIGAKAL